MSENDKLATLSISLSPFFLVVGIGELSAYVFVVDAPKLIDCFFFTTFEFLAVSSILSLDKLSETKFSPLSEILKDFLFFLVKLISSSRDNLDEDEDGDEVGVWIVSRLSC